MIIEIGNKTHEGKFNFYSVKYANEYFKRKAEETNGDTENMLITLYSSVLLSHDPMGVRTLLEFIFAPTKNAGLSGNKLDEYMNEVYEEGKYIELVEELLSEVEKSGFFNKQIRTLYRGFQQVMEDVKTEVLDPMDKIEIMSLQDSLDRAKEKRLI